jgi:hypothetical protein
MTTQIGVEKIVTDPQLLINGGASTVLGAAQAKGTATDLLLTIVAGPVNTSAVAGTATVLVQGSNVTASAASNWTSLSPDKGAIANITASGAQTMHFQNLQSAFYRVNLTGTATADVKTVFNYQPMADSFDTTVA